MDDPRFTIEAPRQMPRISTAKLNGSAAPVGWLDDLQVDDKGTPRNNVANLMKALRSDTHLRDMFALDEMRRTVMQMKPLEPINEPFEPHAVRDSDVTALQEWVQLKGIERLGKDTTFQCVDLRGYERRFHPVRDYLDGLKWDGKPRLDSWLTVYLGAPATPYTAAIGRMVLIAMVARIYQPGCKCDYMLILESKQGWKKSSACAILGGDWFSDDLPDVSTKDAQQHLNGKWVIEVAEMSAMSKADSEKLKSFLTRRVEQYRPSYGRKDVYEPRQCIFVGTTNKAQYLRDETGARRFWPVKVGRIKEAAFKADRDQLLAEAVQRYRDGVAWWPEAEFEQQHIVPEQDARYETDAWQDKIAPFLALRSRVMLLEIAHDCLEMKVEKLGTTEQRRIAAVLEQLGWVRGTKTNKGLPWIRPASNQNDGATDDDQAA